MSVALQVGKALFFGKRRMVDKKTAAAHFSGLPDGDSLEPVHMVLRAHSTHLPGRWLPISLWLLACGGLVVAININLRSANQRASEAAAALAHASLRTDADRLADTSTPDSDPVDEQASTPPLVEYENPFEQSDVPVSESELDQRVISRLEVLGIEPAAMCSDAVFLRRVYLDTIGTLPTAAEAREFLDSTDPDKRRQLIDVLLERPEFADYWAMKWCDVLRVKAEFPINLWPNAAQAYHRWIRNALRDNMPFNEFALELLTSSGSNFRTPQVNFYRAMQGRDPDEIAAIVALTFMGERTEQWQPSEVQQLAVFFSQIGFKPTGEWKEEIVVFDPRRAQLDPEQKDLTAVLPDGSEVMLPEGVDPRTIFADWLIDDRNPRFVYPVVNRVWYWLLGRGIVDPPDDFHAGNPPRNLLLLDYLAAEFVATEYDLKHLYRVILNSATYQRSCLAAHFGSRGIVGGIRQLPRAAPGCGSAHRCDLSDHWHHRDVLEHDSRALYVSA